jgi:hypothetical protein
MELVCLEGIGLRCPLVNVDCVKRWKNLKSLFWVVPSPICPYWRVSQSFRDYHNFLSSSPTVTIYKCDNRDLEGE